MADKRKKKKPLIENTEDEETGMVNPSMEEGSDTQQQSGAESSVEVDETQEAESLIKDLKTKHLSKQKELSKVKSPKDDLAKELRTIKKKSKEKVDETIRQEEAELSATEDGTVPMPTEEEGEAETQLTESVVTFAETTTELQPEEDSVKKLKRKKEKVEEEEVIPLKDEAEETAVKKEEEEVPPPTKPTTPPPEEPAKPPPQEEVKTPRGGLKASMKARLRKAKEEAAAEAEQEQKEEEKKERQLKRDKDKKKTRFDQPEVDEAELEEKARAFRSRLRKIVKQPLEEKGVFMPTADEAFDFFTHDFEPEPEEPKAEEEEESPKPEAEEKEEGEEAGPSEEGAEEEDKKKKKDQEEDEVPLMEDVDEEGYGSYAIRKPEFDDSPEMAKKEAEKLFYPSVTSVNAEDKAKILQDLQPRFLEDEGFYVGTRPKISGWNVNKMENRLIKELHREKWFGEDGRMIVLPNPLRPTPSRPPIPEEQEPELETQYRKAILHEYDNRYIDGSLDNAGFYQLDVDINSLTFSHHHLFSREHVLATRLSQLYEEYLDRQKKNMAEYLTEKLKALKLSAVHLKDHMAAHKSEHDYADRSNFQKRLQDYKDEIRRARALRDKEERTDRLLLKAIIKTWKETKQQREKQKYINTAIKLQVITEETNKELDTSLWKLEIEDELEEVEEEAQVIYKKKMAEYDEAVKKQAEQRKTKEEARVRIHKRGRKQSKGSKGSMGSKASRLSAENEPNPEEEAKDQEILNEPDVELPDKPDEFNKEQARKEIVAKAKEIRRRPGEPKMYPEVTSSQPITETSKCPRAEQQRRDEVSKCKMFMKVLFNNKEVSRTPAKPLTQEFALNFGQIFNLKIVQWPESITYQVYETLGFGGEMICEINSCIPDASVTSQSVQLENLDFSSDHKVNHGHEGVGSGVPFSFGAKNEGTETLYTTGELKCSVAWAVNEQGQPLVPPSSQEQSNMFYAMRKNDPVSAIGASGVVDIQKLAKWFEDSRLDPNDPANADLVYMLKPKGGDPTLLAPKEFFRLEQLQEEFNFCEDEVIDENKRFKLIYLRDSEVTEFKNFKMVPLLDRDIPRDTFTEFEKKKREEDKYKEEKDIESHRAAVSKFMQRVREQVIRRFRLLAHQRRLDDVVNEEAVPNIALLGTSVLKLTERKRPLRVERKERKKVVPQTIENVKILVNINRAVYVPRRVATSQGGAMTARKSDNKGVTNITGETEVQPYIEVMFQDVFLHSEIGDGPNPSFNEELEMPFKAPNDDYTPANLQTVTDNIYLNLFDQVLIDIQEDDRQRGTTVHQRIEKKWLGGLTIPFSTVYFNGKIEGTFKLNKPPVLLGYTQGPDEEEGTTPGSHEENTYISIFMTIEPPLQPPEAMRERFATTEDEKLLQYAENWEKTLNAKFKDREYKTTVIDVNGKTVFVTRYFKALEPPQEIFEKADTEVKKMEVVARYVSMIPSVSDSVVFPGLCDIWSTCDQFLQMMAGDEEEHAVLLANYFMYMKKTTWLIIGKGIPEGPTAYVMTEQESDYWIWNAGTGEHFSYRDSYCPLQSISCLINAENIWANIQQYEKPAQMNFDISQGSSWRPFFSRSFPNTGIASYQPEKLYYKPTNKNAVLDLQEKIETLLKNKIMEWRSRLITRWNRHCTQIMRKLLPILEENLGHNPGEQYLTELENTFSSYKVSGFPINMSYNEITTIVDSVYSTRVHAHETSDVEFALAVYIHPYPNDVLSVWVYVASLIRNR
ncbi:coiled-coil and C2 domain-containing protein 2A-like isoform X2 [Ostrea edulis]|uniref:coiled-coil and C2 domain-containing protein 2A-like isoform X2 n=1 Tax=Ostrea edulis TaxID=37623 RepID=UPI0024AF917B|nr:coiled-coil and C2 domain-containing protein 2A-like isoform X2 [Ostrea edulis]